MQLIFHETLEINKKKVRLVAGGWRLGCLCHLVVTLGNTRIVCTDIESLFMSGLTTVHNLQMARGPENLQNPQIHCVSVNWGLVPDLLALSQNLVLRLYLSWYCVHIVGSMPKPLNHFLLLLQNDTKYDNFINVDPINCKQL